MHAEGGITGGGEAILLKFRAPVASDCAASLPMPLSMLLRPLPLLPRPRPPLPGLLLLPLLELLPVLPQRPRLPLARCLTPDLLPAPPLGDPLTFVVDATAAVAA